MVADAAKNIFHSIQAIERATREQSKGSEQISGAAEKMSDIAREVRKAMSEQSKAIKDYARSIDDTKETVGTIANATKNQSEDGSSLLKSMERFLEIAQKNSDISTEMEEAVEELLQKAQLLRAEMGRFRV
jgi:methyl-accepting chemotaxis protein